jgi:2-oxoglutarate ferredoxin oxidoreductase subunit alpha
MYGSQEEAEMVFVSWGGNKGAILEALAQLALEGIKVAYMHFTHLYPMDELKILPLFIDAKRYVAIENNSEGQLARLIRAETGITIKEKFLRYDGRPFLSEDIVNYVKANR